VKTAAAILLAALVGGCALPQWRVFQAKVDPKLAEKPALQVEGEKRAASYIAKRTAPPVPDPVAAVADVQQVAVGLTASLGEPAKAVVLADKADVLAEMRGALLAKERQLDKWKDFGRKHAGKPIEDTGVNLAGPAGLLGLIGIIAACVACPPLFWALLRGVPVLWGMVRRMSAGIESFAAEVPGPGETLKANYLARKMDTLDKRIVRRRKVGLKAEEISTAATKVPFAA
jgi:hypothetical protein